MPIEIAVQNTQNRKKIAPPLELDILKQISFTLPPVPL